MDARIIDNLAAANSSAETTELVQRWKKILKPGITGVRTLKENLLTNIKAGERFGKALDMSLDVMRKTPHPTEKICF